MPERNYRVLLWTLALVGIGLDQTTKYGMFAWLKERPQQLHTASVFHVDNGLGLAFQARHTYDKETGNYLPQVNSGALNGWLIEYKESANAGFAIISLGAALAIIWWTLKPATARNCWLCIALGLILAGTAGNLYDRIVFNGVRDFLDVYWKESHWPTFNIADSCLVTGVFLFLAQSLASSAAISKQAENSSVPRSAQPIR